MDTRLLAHYETELAFLRDMGAEFASAYPKIAARLGMEGMEVLDPYVERLLEGTAFLSARVQLALEMQFPAFTSNLLETVCSPSICRDRRRAPRGSTKPSLTAAFPRSGSIATIIIDGVGARKCG